MRNNNLKGRSQITYNHKVKRMTKLWKSNKKLQEKFTLDNWLSKIKKVNK